MNELFKVENVAHESQIDDGKWVCESEKGLVVTLVGFEMGVKPNLIDEIFTHPYDYQIFQYNNPLQHENIND